MDLCELILFTLSSNYHQTLLNSSMVQPQLKLVALFVSKVAAPDITFSILYLVSFPTCVFLLKFCGPWEETRKYKMEAHCLSLLGF